MYEFINEHEPHHERRRDAPPPRDVAPGEHACVSNYLIIRFSSAATVYIIVYISYKLRRPVDI